MDNPKVNKIIEIYQQKIKKLRQPFIKLKTIDKKFEELSILFFTILEKGIGKKNTTIDERNEFDIIRGIGVMISGNTYKRDALKFENNFKSLTIHRKKLNELFIKNNIKIEPRKDPLIIENPEYGYHY